MLRNMIAFYPFTLNQLIYINLTQQMIESKYDVIDYLDLKRGLYDLLSVRTIYLNWIEDKLDSTDRKILKIAKLLHINIVWVFHNKVTHDTKNVDESIKNIQFLIRISSKIIILSHSSLKFLKEYVPALNMRKVHFIPHLEFVDDYGDFGKAKDMIPIGEDDFVFALYGRICRYKNIEILIKAFQQLDASYKCKLVIAGGSESEDYVDELRGLIKGNERIILSDKYIQDLEMGYYLNLVDVLVLPYNVESGMNSGAMIMAFSYKTTVIVSDIAMADEYDDNLIYRYSYSNEEDHIKKLAQKMEEAYCEGKQKNAEKGLKLYNQVLVENAKEKVKDELLCLL